MSIIIREPCVITGEGCRQVAQWAINLSYRLQPSLRPRNGSGRKQT